MTDDELDTLLKNAAKNQDRSVPQGLVERVLADADRLQPRPAPARPVQKGRWLDEVLEAIGGWMGPAAVAASLFVGIGIGALDGGTVSGLIGIETVEVLDDLDLGEFDLVSAEW